MLSLIPRGVTTLADSAESPHHFFFFVGAPLRPFLSTYIFAANGAPPQRNVTQTALSLATNAPFVSLGGAPISFTGAPLSHVGTPLTYPIPLGNGAPLGDDAPLRDGAPYQFVRTIFFKWLRPWK